MLIKTVGILNIERCIVSITTAKSVTKLFSILRLLSNYIKSILGWPS